MTTRKRSVLITGCTDPAGIGAALAIAFHNAGLHVYATGRDVERMSFLKDRGIDTLVLDVTNSTSIADCVAKVSSLDMLVNNAGRNLPMPVLDLDLNEARKIFELNTWGPLAVSKAFLPLLLQSPNPIIATTTSVANCTSMPFQGVYSASKAASAKFLDIMRVELEPWNVRVVELRAGLVLTGMLDKVQGSSPKLPSNSIFQPVKELAEHEMAMHAIDNMGITADAWADSVVESILWKDPPYIVWKGTQSSVAYWSTWLSTGLYKWLVCKISVMGQIHKLIKDPAVKEKPHELRSSSPKSRKL
ncbi:NAD(P)-binding protein [Sarocladium strictum]